MARFTADEFETKNNIEAMGSNIGAARRVNITDSVAFNQPSPMADDDGATDKQADQIDDRVPADLAMSFSEVELLMKSAYSSGISYQQQVLSTRWQASANAWNNTHNSDSKYNQMRYRGRTKLFRPKTRSALRSKSAEAAAALFSASDVVSVKGADDSDEMQRASGQINHELLNMRLDRSNEKAGIPWFLIAMGAHQSALLHGICASKQFWEYQAREIVYTETINIPVPNAMNMDGSQLTIPQEREVRETKIIKDKPRIRLYPPEDVIRDPASAWDDQAQDSSYLILRNPMPIIEAKEFTKNNPMSPVKFIELTDGDFLAAPSTNAGDSGASAAVRRSREQQGNDRFTDNQVDNRYRIVHVNENFFRLGGVDYVFWSLGNQRIISNIVPVEQAYPEQAGARPCVIGVGMLDVFKIDPMSAAEQVQPLQQEINDIVNLRLDTVKQTVAPLALVRRGRSIDVRAIQNRSPDSVVYVGEKDDVTFDRPGDVSASAYQEMERLNADFDDLAGTFSSGSVQTNRSLNETVGGMQLMAAGANSIGEFDLKVWIETWVEPVLRQLVALEQYYESDETIIALAAKKANLYQRYGTSEIMDELLGQQVTTTVNVGMGSADPNVALDKFAKAASIAISLVPQAQQMARPDEIINEIFGKAGYKNAADRFFAGDISEDPRLTQANQVIQQLQGSVQALQQENQDKEADRQLKWKVARVNAIAGLAKQEMSQQMQERQQFTQAAIDATGQARDQQFQMEQGDIAHERAKEMSEIERAEQPGEYQGGGEESMQSLLGLNPDPRMMEAAGSATMAAQAAQASAQALAEGLKIMAQAMMQGMADIAQQIAESNAQTAQSNREMVIAMQRSGAEQAAASRSLEAAIRAPKTIRRDQNGFAQAVETRG